MQYEYQELGQSSIQIIDGDRGKNYPKGRDFSPNGYCLFLNAKMLQQMVSLFQRECLFQKKRISYCTKENYGEEI